MANYAPEPPLNEVTNAITAFRAGGYVVPAGYVGMPMTDAEHIAAIPDAIKTMATGSKRYLIGVTYADVAKAYVEYVTAARLTLSPQQLLKDCILSVYVAYTLSSTWAPTYTTFGGRSLFSQFDIVGRQGRDGPAGKDAWVATGAMNATAVHMLGYMLIECAGANTFLAQVRELSGSPFNPPLAADDSPQAKIMREAAGKITAADRDALVVVRTLAPQVHAILAALFGAGAVNIATVAAAAAAFPPTLI